MSAAPKCILVVEDELMIAMHIEATLSDLGHQVRSAISIEEASAALADGGIDLVILDYHLKDGTSENLARSLSERGIAFVICSGTAGMEELGEVFRRGAFLPKPFTSELLLSAVSSVAG